MLFIAILSVAKHGYRTRKHYNAMRQHEIDQRVPWHEADFRGDQLNIEQAYFDRVSRLLKQQKIKLSLQFDDVFMTETLIEKQRSNTRSD